MPYSPSRPCTHPGCPHLSPCPDHVRSGKPFASAKRSSSLYDTQRWKDERANHLICNPRCVECGAIANTVDHEPPHRGDVAAFWDRRRFVSMCRKHHNAKTGRETRMRV